MPASPFASRGSERPIQMERLSTPPKEILPGQQGHTPWRPARCLRLRGRLTRAMTDSHRAALLTRLASGASTRHQPFAAPRSRLAIRPLAAKRSPASISISIASRVDAAGSRKRRGGLPSMGQRTLGTVAINGSRPTGNHHSATMPASPFASRGSERPIQMERLSTPPKEILPGQQGHTPSRPARRSSPRGRLTRATTDSHRAALPARAASGASTPLQPPRPLRAGSPSGPSPPNAAPCHLYLNGDQS